MKKHWAIEFKVDFGQAEGEWEVHPRRFWTRTGAEISARSSMALGGLAAAFVSWRVIRVP